MEKQLSEQKNKAKQLLILVWWTKFW